MLHPRFLLLAGLVSAFYLRPGAAAEDWNLCRIPAISFVQSADIEAGETQVEARSIVSEEGDILQLSGDARLTRAGQKITAEQMRIDKSSEQIEASGQVVFEDENQRLESPEIRVDNRKQKAIFIKPEFELRSRHARGQADIIEKLDQDRSRFTGLIYTSCDPGESDWHLRASAMEIDDASGRGTARHTTLYFKEIPFLYLPWFQFPIDDRRMSGLLTPGIGYSDSGGSSLSLPVYWNLALNYDMTITPTWYSERGLQYNSENRYLFGRQRGQLDLSYLDDRELQDSRWYQQWRHNIDLNYRIDADLLLAKVSDGEFFDDFDSIAPAYRDTRHLERYLRFNRNGDNWDTQLLWQNYQTLDTTTTIANRPYNRLPRLSLSGEPDPVVDSLRTPLEAEWVSFDRDDSITGERAHLATSMIWQASDSWYFLEPELQFAFTDYRLENTSADDNINRSLPTLGIDSGLIFERLAGSRKQWLQTLEPRLYFLHTPFEDQDEIPDFDTSLNSRTYANLFRNNRFTGVDRIGDANQITLGLASRIYDNDSGDELLHLRTGQIFYFKDRRVSLSGNREDASKSDVITELDIRPNARTTITARLVYEQQGNEVADRDFAVNYSDDGFAANLGYYFSEDELEQALLSMVYPINERWTVVAKWHRSLRFSRPVENLFGLNYESCCWGLKILAGQTGDDDDDFSETDNSIYFELTLKGLSQAGRDIDAQLNDAIPGYESGF